MKKENKHPRTIQESKTSIHTYYIRKEKEANFGNGSLILIIL